MSGKKKIHILGGPGSGKSYLAQLVAKELRNPVLDLDNIFWDNRDNSYDITSEPEKRDLALSKFLAQESWVVEGVYYRWLEDSFKQADHIIGALLIGKPVTVTGVNISRIAEGKLRDYQSYVLFEGFGVRSVPWTF